MVTNISAKKGEECLLLCLLLWKITDWFKWKSTLGGGRFAILLSFTINKLKSNNIYAWLEMPKCQTVCIWPTYFSSYLKKTVCVRKGVKKLTGTLLKVFSHCRDFYQWRSVKNMPFTLNCRLTSRRAERDGCFFYLKRPYVRCREK